MATKKITVEFPNKDLSYVIVRGYRKSGLLYSTDTFKNCIEHSVECYRYDGSIWNKSENGESIIYETFGEYIPE